MLKVAISVQPESSLYFEDPIPFPKGLVAPNLRIAGLDNKRHATIKKMKYLLMGKSLFFKIKISAFSTCASVNKIKHSF